MNSLLKCFVIGDPIAHSRSPIIHQYLANVCKNAKQPLRDFIYQRQHIPADQTLAFEYFVTNFFQENDALGLNITLPFKFRAFELATSDSASLDAQLAHSANTLSLKNGQIYAHNTDGIGLVSDLMHKGVNLEGARIVIIGAGGATFGVLYALLQAKVENIFIANRSLEKLKKLLGEYQQRLLALGLPQKMVASLHALAFDELPNLLNINLLINATPLGLISKSDLNNQQEQDKDKDICKDTCKNRYIDASEQNLANILESLPASFYHYNYHYHYNYNYNDKNQKTTCVYEMAYGLPQTIFSEWAQKHDLKYHQGLGMLLEQAKASFLHWQAPHSLQNLLAAVVANVKVEDVFSSEIM